MAGKLDGRVAVVTGSSSGNGRAIAVALAREGAKIVCSDLKRSALSAGYEADLDLDTDVAITKAGGTATFVSADASKAADVRNVIEHAVAAHGRLDITVNNAGVFTGLHSIIDETEEQYDFTMNVNAKGVWLGCKYAITQFMKQEPLKTSRVGTPEDVARAAVFLASDDAEWMTGSMLTVDGAFTAR
ncbi:SDR family NAD(P)-dependent oxidoreductase [Caballeronia novacaledonica]|uniref:Short-chain dehydrogenase/reductase SDR n=1 Tax=Caballeronia novacaledonica TaxID=1544861 RepID=A0AA37IBP2_9BURK|nr:SDR family oxidoreductase [Caballeronia novacaledonica]GJH26991.1 hypothetical protein CBA19CS42_20765 [Caballeronia novacaledonica]